MKQSDNNSATGTTLLSQAVGNIVHVFFNDLPLGATYLKIISHSQTPEDQVLKAYKLIRNYIKDQNIAEIIVDSLKIIRKLCMKDQAYQTFIDNKVESLIEMQVIKDISTGSQSQFISLVKAA